MPPKTALPPKKTDDQIAQSTETKGNHDQGNAGFGILHIFDFRHITGQGGLGAEKADMSTGNGTGNDGSGSQEQIAVECPGVISFWGKNKTAQKNKAQKHLPVFLT